MQSTEHVLVPVGRNSDGVMEAGVVMMVWLNEDETPMEMVARLVKERDEALKEGGEDLKEIVRRALDSVRDAISENEQVQSYVSSVESATQDVDHLLSTAQDELESIE